ncbi:MAG: hypothetical protein ABI743_00190 [bacterium]
MASIIESLRDLDKLYASLENEIAELEQTLEQRRAALDKLAEIKVLAGGAPARRRGGRRPGAGRKAKAAPAKAAKRSPRGANRDRVVQVLHEMGTARAVEIANEVKDRYPDFGGTSYKTQVFAILQKEPRIEKIGRGLYKVGRGK